MNTALLEGKERRKQKEVLAWETWINSQKAPDLLLRAVIKELGWTPPSAPKGWCQRDGCCPAPEARLCSQWFSRLTDQAISGVWVSHGQWSQLCYWWKMPPWRPQAKQMLPLGPDWCPVPSTPWLLSCTPVSHGVPPFAYSWGPAPVCTHHSFRPPSWPLPHWYPPGAFLGGWGWFFSRQTNGLHTF